jgi:hypothetical protein
VATTDSSLSSPDRQVFMTTNETRGPSGPQPDRFLEDISADELSANTPVTNRVFGEENPTPCTILIVPGSVSYHVQKSLQNNIISIQ